MNQSISVRLWGLGDDNITLLLDPPICGLSSIALIRA
jgi:hypothetical protein